MAYRKEEIYTKDCNGTTIMLIPNDELWEVYLRKPQYPFMYAFDVDYWRHDVDEMFELAKANIEQYEFLFDE